MNLSVRHALAINAWFSLATGLVLTVVPVFIGNQLGLDVDRWLRSFGIALIGHGAFLWWVRFRPDPRPWARLNLVAIAPYPFLMIGLVVGGVVDWGIGTALVVVDGAVVAAIAWWLWRALRDPADAQGARVSMAR